MKFIKKIKMKILVVIGILLIVGCKETQKKLTTKKSELEFVTPLGKKFEIKEPSAKMLELFEEAKINFEKDSKNLDNIIWYGRRTAYLGKYEKAIEIYSKGIELYPEESRLYRHRGHRFISLRKYDQAINDLQKAARLIEGKKNKMEEDGLPNAQNIPISSQHGNIWYHLGLAYYLKHEYQKSFDAYIKCRASGNNDDNIVSSTHWLYMNQRKLGNIELANQMLLPIKNEANIIENKSYHDLCRFYKGLIPLDSLVNTKKGNPSSDAILYGLANWHFYTNNKTRAQNMMNEMMESNAWSSFGYLAAESDILEYFSEH